MTRARRPSAQTVAVLVALSGSSRRWRYGYDLCQELGIQAGTVYPILMRLAAQGWLETTWEQAHAPGRPPRHLYRLTRSGASVASDVRAARPSPRPRLQTAEG